MLVFDWILYGAGKTFRKFLIFSHLTAVKQDWEFCGYDLQYS